MRAHAASHPAAQLALCERCSTSHASWRARAPPKEGMEPPAEPVGLPKLRMLACERAALGVSVERAPGR